MSLLGQSGNRHKEVAAGMASAGDGETCCLGASQPARAGAWGGVGFPCTAGDGRHACLSRAGLAGARGLAAGPCAAETLCFVGRFYRKARISGQLDWECIPCTKQTPSSEPQCMCRPSPAGGRAALG